MDCQYLKQSLLLLQQSPDLYVRQFKITIDGYVRNALQNTNNETISGISLIIYNHYQKNLIFKWPDRNITNLSQCVLHEFLYIWKLGINSLNDHKECSVHRQRYPVQDLLRLAIKYDIDGKRFKELNKHEDNLLFCKQGPLKMPAMYRLTKFINDFNFKDIESGLLCILPIIKD